MEAVLKASGADNFAKQFNNASKSVKSVEDNTKKASVSIGGMIKAAAGVAATIGIFNTLKNSVDGAISRYDTLNTFPKIMEMMGHSAEDSEGAIQKLSDGIQGLPTTLDDVAKTTQRIATLTGDLGGAVDTTLALNNAFITSGASVADASRGLDQYVQMLSKGEVDLQSWRTLQETMGVGLNETAKAFGFAGESAQNDLYDALKSGEITFDEFNNKLIELSNETGGFADMAKTSAGGIKTAFTNMRTSVVRGVTNIISKIDEMLASNGLGSIESIVNQAGKAFFSALDSMANAIPPVVSAIKSVYENLKPWLPLITSIIAGVVAFQSTFAIINTVKNAVLGLKVAMALLNATILANPITIIVALLAGLAVAFYLLYQRSETFRNTVNSLFETFRSFVMPIIQVVVDFIMSIWGQLVSWWQQNNQMILQAAQNVWNFISSFITNTMNVIWSIMQTIWPFIRFLIVDTWNAIKGVIQGAIDVITGIIQFFAALFTGDWKALWAAVKQILSGAVKLIWNLVQLWFVGKILKAGKALFNGLKAIVTSIWTTIKSLFTNGINTARNVVNVGFNFIRSIISTIMNGVKSIISGIWNGIKNTTSTVLGNIKNTVKRIFDSLKGVVTNAFNGVKKAVKDGITGALNNIKNMFGMFKDAGKNIITSIASGIKGAIGSVTDAIGNVTGKIRDFLPFSPAKEGALRDIMKIQIPQSIAKSIEAGERVATKAMDGLTNAIYGHMPEMDINAAVSSASVKSSITHDVNQNDGRMVQLLEKIANSKGVVKLNTGELVGATYNEYDRTGGQKTSLNERWGK